MQRSFPFPSQQKSESGCEYASERTTARAAAELSTGEGSEVVPGRRSLAQEGQAEHAKEEPAAAAEAEEEEEEVHPCQVGAVVAEQQRQISVAHGPPVPHRIHTLIRLARPPSAKVAQRGVVQVD